MASSKPASAAPGTCPICSRPAVPDYRPFCSRRCADVDLSRWLRGSYAIPDTEASDEDGNTAAQPPGRDGDDDGAKR
jgi:endogenous inhibitor of DNA gyrase (YacG/DUF329 family)